MNGGGASLAEPVCRRTEVEFPGNRQIIWEKTGAAPIVPSGEM
jgi:hypothetical protein